MGKLKVVNVVSLVLLSLIVIGLMIWSLIALFSGVSYNTNLIVFFILLVIFILLIFYLISVIRSQNRYKGWIKSSAVINVLAVVQIALFWIWGRIDTLKCIAENGNKCGLAETLLIMFSFAVAGVLVALSLLSWIIGNLRNKQRK